MAKRIKVKKDMKLKQFLFGDFDKDGIPNVDDPRPFDPKVRRIWGRYQSSKYYDKEVSLAKQLKLIKKHNDAHIPFYKKVLRENEGSIGRIKSVPSTIKKLRSRYQPEIMDVAGVTVFAKDRKNVYKKAKRIKKKYKIDPKETDDFYKKPKANVYYAYHMSLLSPKKRRVEIQVKTKPQFRLHKKMHESYKKEGSLQGFIRKAKNLFKRGY